MRKISAQRVIGTLVLLFVCSAGAASTVLARRIRLRVGCGRHQVAAQFFSRQSGSQHSLPMCGKCSRLPESCLTRLCLQAASQMASVCFLILWRHMHLPE